MFRPSSFIGTELEDNHEILQYTAPGRAGDIPELPENKVLEVHNFDAKTFCEEIGREAWGYIDF